MPPPTVPGVVNCVAYAKGRKVADVAIEDISEALKQPDVFVWLGLYEPGSELLARVQQEFGLHELAVEDALLAHQRPKLERYGDCLFMALRTAQMDMERRRAAFGETHLFVGARYVVSVRHGASLSYAPVRDRCEAESCAAELGALPSCSTRSWTSSSTSTSRWSTHSRLSSSSSRTSSSASGSSRGASEAIYHLKRNLLELKRAVSPLVDICNRLVRFDLELDPGGGAAVHPRRLRPLRPDQRVGGHAARAPDLGAGGEPVPHRGGPERVHEEAGGLGGHLRRAHHDRGGLRHELRAHARAALDGSAIPSSWG